MAMDMGKTRRVSINPTQGKIGAPPAPTASQKASAARYKGSAKQRRDLAAAKARVGKRPRRAGPMKSQQAIVTFPGAAAMGGGGGGAMTAPEEEKAWWENYWLWLAVAGVWLATRNRRRRR